MTSFDVEAVQEGGARRTDVPGALRLRGLTIDPPLLNASGAFDVASADPDWAAEPAVARHFGTYVTKTVTQAPRTGNLRPWVALLPGDGESLVNSVGLANPGIVSVARTWATLPALLGRPVLLSVGAATPAALARLVERAEELAPWVSGYELNLSCPNDRCAGSPIAADPRRVEEACSLVRAQTARPLLAKLTPMCADIGDVARAAEHGGADAVTAINTLAVRAVDGDGGDLLGSPDGGLSGRALHLLALRCVAAAARAVEIPVVGVGGVTSPAAAGRMFAAGASAVATGTGAALFPALPGQLAGMFAAKSRA